uniref:DnaJ homolog subfamily C member 10 n=1 Tax=Astyanax mexicanus TaxID=7994 RepID=A0A8B9RML1_ASTMX
MRLQKSSVSTVQNCLKPWRKKLLFLFIFTWLVVSSHSDEDYYKLLGISRDSSTREIRQAFKKLALTMHPDKNPNDETAHEKFLKINRAYEVLKDEDLRKKYDKYGEKGLQDEQHGGRYESWNFYRYDFGIYDEDPEIITLDRGDFDAAVNSGEVWFVNFYFPRCSHCHDLAPTWREFAKEMDGVIRISAVNCGDNNRLCRSKGISSYPSLFIFRAGMNPEKYYGERSKHSLTKFAMQYVTSKVTELWQGNVFTEIDQAFSERIGWLITFCADTGDCLEAQTRQKLAGMLDGVVKVGWMDCTLHAELCESFDVTSSSTALFPPGSSLAQEGSVLLVCVCASLVILCNVLYCVCMCVCVCVCVQVGKVDCVSEAELCASIYIQKSCVAVFKGLGVHDFEIHHGKEALYNIVAFAKESVSAHVTTLRPENFPRDGKEPWLVDFFAPWCPPCRALLPELRKASIQLYGQMKFGTLDCTIHEGLCSRYNINAYPTTFIFNKSSVHEYEGHHSADGILEFIQDLVNPAVVTLTPDTFQQLVKRRKQTETWVVDFYAPWCGPCQALLPEWRRMARMLSGVINVGTVDCQKHHSLCQSENVRAYPEIRLFPQNSNRRDQYQYDYNGWHRDAQSLKTWALSSLPRASVDLTPEDFKRKILEGKEHWVLDFYAPWCGPCQHFAPEFEILARMLKGTVRAGKVDCQAHYQTCQSAGITAYPTVRFYPYLGTQRRQQGGEYINSRDSNVISDVIHQRLQQLALKNKSKLKVQILKFRSHCIQYFSFL